MTLHEWVHKTLMASAELLELAKGGVVQSSSLIAVPAAKPFVVHRLSGTSPLLSREEAGPARSTGLRVTVHDEPGTYDRIGDVLFEVQVALLGEPKLVSELKIMACRWEGDSPQLPEDVKTGTISQFAQFRLIHTK